MTVISIQVNCKMTENLEDIEQDNLNVQDMICHKKIFYYQ